VAALAPLERAMLAAERNFDEPGAVRWGARALKRARAEDAAVPSTLVPGAPPPARVRVGLALGEALLRAGNPNHAEPAFREALGVAGKDPRVAARARRGLARAALANGRIEAAEEELISALEDAGGPNGDGAMAGELALELAEVRHQLDRARDAETALIQGAVKAPATPGVSWRLLLALAEHNHAACRSIDALNLGQQALSAAIGSSPLAAARVHAFLGVVEQALGDTQAASGHRTAALDALRALGDRRATAELLLGSALAGATDHVMPRRWLAEAGELARQVGWLEGVARAQEALRMLA
jgi:hypothetical protein